MSIHDDKLEAAIDRAGRWAVFEAARQAGWGPFPTGAPPKWVWWEIVRAVNRTQTSAE